MSHVCGVFLGGCEGDGGLARLGVLEIYKSIVLNDVQVVRTCG